MNTSARFYLLYNSRNMLKTLQLHVCVFKDSTLYKERTLLTFILSKHDVIDLMMFCNCDKAHVYYTCEIQYLLYDNITWTMAYLI